MYYSKPLVNPANGKELIEFRMGITSWDCSDADENDYMFLTEEIEPILEYNHVTMYEVFPGYESLIDEFKDSSYKDVDSFIKDKHPYIVLEPWEKDDFKK